MFTATLAATDRTYDNPFEDMASSTVVASKGVKRLIAAKRKKIADLDDEFFGEVVGVAQAIDALRGALSEVSACLDHREFEKASALGYGKVAEEFIFLQRTLGGLQDACMHKEKLVCDLAVELRRSYEEVVPEVDALMQSARPLDRKQRNATTKGHSRIRARTKTMTRSLKTTTPRRRGRSGLT
jgi:hypothetical protein